MWDKRVVFPRKNLLFSCVHFLVSCVLSASFFKPIRENAGSENIAYKFLRTGASLPEDALSRLLCCVYAYALAFLLIYLFWNFLFFLSDRYKNGSFKKSGIMALLIIVIIGFIIIAAVYPQTVADATDTTWNYVYAKEWLPIYWHGYLTNVIHCASMIIIPHPVAMSLVPFLIGVNGACYFTYEMLLRDRKGGSLFILFIWSLFLMTMPETFMVFTYAGRNYMYALLSVAYIGGFLNDYIREGGISTPKFIRQALLALVLATWRSEGIIYLVFFPILFYFAYFRKVCKKEIIFLVVFYLILALPGKYGDEKYQGYDYVIVNTPAPLTAVFSQEYANLSYDGVEEDLVNIFSVVPKEYFDKYGSWAQFYYNFDKFRSPRQNNAGEQGKKYVVASYSVLLHNWKIYLKNQINFFAGSIGCRQPFSLQEPVIEDWTKSTTEEAVLWFEWIWDYFDIGKNNMTTDYNIVLVNEKVDNFLNKFFSSMVNRTYKVGWSVSGYVKIVVSIWTMIVCVTALLKKEWLFFFTGILILGILAAIILTAPTMRENYYYSPYFNQYWYLFFYNCYMFKKKEYVKANV